MAEEKKKIHIVTDREILDIAAELKEAWLQCRSSGHDFRLRSVDEIETDAPGHWYEVVYVCRCTSRKTIIKNAETGQEQGGNITYAIGYLMTGVGRLPLGARQLFRKEQVDRFLRGA